jgi:SAM-dependent methyltransferase
MSPPQSSSEPEAEILELEENLEEEYNRLEKTLPNTDDEEELVDEFVDSVETIFREFGQDISEVIEREEEGIGLVRIDGRFDALVGFALMEFKRYGRLNTDAEFESAEDQIITQYLDNIPENQRDKYVGIIFDGVTYAKIEWDENLGDWVTRRKNFNLQSFHDILNIIGGSTKKLISGDNIVNDFNINSELSQEVISSLYHKLEEEVGNNPEVDTLFKEWESSFSHIYGGVLDSDRIQRDFQEVADEILDTEIQPDLFLFALYTYYGILVKVIAAEVSTNHVSLVKNSIVRTLFNSEDTQNELGVLEDGSFFRESVGVANYMEANYFSWYLYAWDNDVEDALLQLLNHLDGYDLRSFELELKQSRDLLKILYQEVIPKRIRHDLGEYYTPDWLIDSTVNQTGYSGGEDERILDPGCGSGGFLVECITKIRANAERGIDSDELFQRIRKNVYGIDVNPVAVLTARTNYLLATADLIPDNPESNVDLPIFMADSVITPTTEGQGRLSGDTYKFSTSSGVFELPKELIEEDTFEQLVHDIEDAPNLGIEPLTEHLLEKDRYSGYEEEIRNFCDELSEVPEGLRAIWARIMLNSSAPLYIGTFDYIVGNPPWIKWEFLDEGYKQRLETLYLDIYELFSHSGMEASLGYAHDDISVVFMFVVIDKYLREDGLLSFVVKQTLYKSQASSELRKFKIEKNGDSDSPLKVEQVLDLLEIDPFESSSETSVLVLRKGKQNEYPVDYQVWHERPEDSVKEDNDLDVVLSKTIREDKIAIPDPDDDDELAPWIVTREEDTIPSLGGESNFYQARHGIVNDLVNAFFIEIEKKTSDGYLKFNNNPEYTHGNSKDVKQNEVEKIEAEYVYPMAKSRHVNKWNQDGYYNVIIPQKKAGADNKDELKGTKLYEYLKEMRGDLNSRSSSWVNSDDKPFYSIFGIGEYTFTPYRVVWTAMGYSPEFCVVSDIGDDLLGQKPILPDNPIGYVPAQSEKEAHYICGVLNSTPVFDYFDARAGDSKWEVSIGKVNEVPIPQFDPDSSIHTAIARLSGEIHELAEGDGSEADIRDKERELDERVYSLFEVEPIAQDQSQAHSYQRFNRIPVSIPDNVVGRDLGNSHFSDITFNLLDLETTGYSANDGDKIVEVWIGKYRDGGLENDFHRVVHPERSIPDRVAEYHGISDETVEGEPAFNEIGEEILEFLGDDPVVCHHADFDATFLNHELDQMGRTPRSNFVLDTLQMARRQLDFANNDLDSLADELLDASSDASESDIDGENMNLSAFTGESDSSQAKEDVEKMSEIFYWMLEKFDEELEDEMTLELLLEIQGECKLLNRF